MYLGTVIAVVIVFLIAAYMAIKKRESETSNIFFKKEKSAKEEVSLTDKPAPQMAEQKNSDNSKISSPPEPPLAPPSEPEAL